MCYECVVCVIQSVQRERLYKNSQAFSKVSSICYIYVAYLICVVHVTNVSCELHMYHSCDSECAAREALQTQNRNRINII